MRTYYLFKINESIYNISKDDPFRLYIILNKLYKLKDIKYEVKLYNDICNLIDNDVIINYIEKTYKYSIHNNKYLIDNYLIEINRSNIVIKSMVNIPSIFKTLNIYSKHFLVIDFDNKDYFWLNNIVEKINHI